MYLGYPSHFSYKSLLKTYPELGYYDILPTIETHRAWVSWSLSNNLNYALQKPFFIAAMKHLIMLQYLHSIKMGVMRFHLICHLIPYFEEQFIAFRGKRSQRKDHLT